MSVFPPSTPARKSHPYSRRYRLTRAVELERVRQSGKRFRTEHLEARVVASLFPYCRLAVVVGKHGHTVVARNRLRRRLRELARIVLIPECRGFDVMLHGFPQAYGATFDMLRSEVETIAQNIPASAA